MKHQRLIMLFVGAAVAIFTVFVITRARDGGFALLASRNATWTTGRAAGMVKMQTPKLEARAGAFNHQLLDQLLAAHIDDKGLVDYEGLRGERAVLDTYLERVADAAPQNFADDEERLAFWINSYNAFTLRDVLDDVYQKARSVKKVRGFFDRKLHRVAGEELTLNEIEKRGQALRDPRMHFAINCASNSCPALQSFAYTGERLESQLGEATREFLSDPDRGLRIDKARNRIAVSPVFKWYADDFRDAAGATPFAGASTNTLLAGDTLARMWQGAGLDVFQFITEQRPEVEYLEYDWSLNSQPARDSAARQNK